MLKWIALAFGLMLAACQTTSPAHSATFGIQCVSANTCPVALLTAQSTLGVPVARMGVSYPVTAGQNTAATGYVGAGNTLFLAFGFNTNGGTICQGNSDATFLANLQAAWAALQSDGVTAANVYAAAYGNEVDDPTNGCAAAQYLHDFDVVFIPWAHSVGLKATDSGITYTGMEMAYYYAAANCTSQTTCAPTAKSDQFYSLAMSPTTLASNQQNPYCSNNNPCVSQLPTSCSPSTAFNATYWSRLQMVQAMIADFATDGEDYTDYHWFWAGAQPIALMLPWLSAQTNRPLLTGATGTSSLSGADVTNVLGAEVAGGTQLVLWYVPDGSGGGASVGLLNADGSIRPTGAAFIAFTAASQATPSVRAPSSLGVFNPPKALC